MTSVVGELPPVGVVYDFGAASAGEIAAASEGVCRPVLLCDFTLPAVNKQAALLRATADLIDIGDAGDDEVVALLGARGVVGLTTFSETQLVRTGRIAAGAGIAYHSTRTIELCTDKRAQRRALRDVGVGGVEQAEIGSPADLVAAVGLIGFPCVLKPARGVGSRHAYLLRSEGDSEAVLRTGALDQDEAFVLESFLEGDESVAGIEWGDYVSVEGLTQDGTYHPICVTGKLPFAKPFRETGIVLPATVPIEIQDECIRVAEGAVAALGINRGVTHTELKLTAQGPGVIEVNARVGGYVPALLKRGTGFDIVNAELRAAMGTPVTVPPLNFQSVEFQYFLQPPIGSHRVVSIEGAGDLRRLPGVLRVERGIKVGDPIDVGKGTGTYIAAVHGSVADHGELLRLIAEMHQMVRVEVD